MEDSLSPWVKGEKVLSAKGFPSASALRFKQGNSGRSVRRCTCGKYNAHRSAPDFLKEVVTPYLGSLFKGKDLGFPEVEVCYNMATLWDDRIPASLTGCERDCKLEEVSSIRQAELALRTSTYWYQRLAKSKNGRSRHATALLRLLGGFTGFSDRKQKVLDLLNSPVQERGIKKLRQILATVDGLLAQLMFSFPEKEMMWTWSTYDRITLSVIKNLLPDYLRPKDDTRPTYYAGLKEIRKRIKQEGYTPSGDLSKIGGLRRFSFLIPLLNDIGSQKTIWNMVKISLLSQTRAAGVPPPSLKTKALREWVALAKQPSDLSLAEEVMPVVTQAVDDFYDEVTSKVGEDQLVSLFRDCSRSAKISLSDSAELSVPTLEGGKLEATRRVVSKLGKVKEIDLETGRETGKFFTLEDGGIGEMIFHHTLSRWKSGAYTDNKMSVKVSTVSELGKYRTVTVSSLDHVVLLHPMSHMTLAFFAKYAETSAGIKAGNQAWEFFRRLSGANPAAGFIFDETQKKSVMSTDWTRSTDYCDHYLARGMLNRFLYRTGLPTFYRRLCIFALTSPRLVVQPLSDEGKPWLTARGVLMGDPGTKTVLTLYHPVVKQIAKRYLREVESNLHDESNSSDSDPESDSA